MFKHILVPLDGSPMAERALGPARQLAVALKAGVTLLHVVEARPPAKVHGARHLAGVGEAQEYLDATAARAFEGVDVVRHVHAEAVGDAAAGIAEHERELNADLVVMSAHGRGRLRTLLFGNAILRVLERGSVPVMLVPAEGGPFDGPTRSILSPLDGDPAHEAGACVAAGLAKALGAQVRLALVSRTPGTLRAEQSPAAELLPGSTRVLLEIDAAEGARYVEALARRVREGGVNVVTETDRGQPARVIKAIVGRENVDLIVLGTHVRAGAKAFWEGSVAWRVCAETAKPVMLVMVGRGKTG